MIFTLPLLIIFLSYFTALDCTKDILWFLLSNTVNFFVSRLAILNFNHYYLNGKILFLTVILH